MEFPRPAGEGQGEGRLLPRAARGRKEAGPALNKSNDRLPGTP
jgi:hypothetical protein